MATSVSLQKSFPAILSLIKELNLNKEIEKLSFT